MINIKLDKFEGPLGLLLKLIEKEELDITQVSLAKITDQYIDYIKKITNMDPEEMADFLVVASKLLLIKSRALLPFLYPEDEEGDSFALEQQLKIYKEFLEASRVITKLIGRKRFMFAREFNRKAVLATIHFFSPPKNLDKETLKNIFSNFIIDLRPEKKMQEERMEYKITIEEKILAIQQTLINKIKTSFNSIFVASKSKAEVVIGFLALLELIKQGSILAAQEGLFSEIEIKNRMFFKY
jgi:segregation and condensation protein A